MLDDLHRQLVFAPRLRRRWCPYPLISLSTPFFDILDLSVVVVWTFTFAASVVTTERHCVEPLLLGKNELDRFTD
jgi:hypothetical protein